MSTIELELDTIPRTIKKSAQEIAEEVAKNHGISVENLLGRVRYRHFQEARVEFYKLLRQQGWSYPAIGNLMNRDHSTIIQALQGHRG